MECAKERAGTDILPSKSSCAQALKKQMATWKIVPENPGHIPPERYAALVPIQYFLMEAKGIFVWASHLLLCFPRSLSLVQESRNIRNHFAKQVVSSIQVRGALEEPELDTLAQFLPENPLAFVMQLLYRLELFKPHQADSSELKLTSDLYSTVFCFFTDIVGSKTTWCATQKALRLSFSPLQPAIRKWISTDGVPPRTMPCTSKGTCTLSAKTKRPNLVEQMRLVSKRSSPNHFFCSRRLLCWSFQTHSGCSP